MILATHQQSHRKVAFFISKWKLSVLHLYKYTYTNFSVYIQCRPVALSVADYVCSLPWEAT